MQSPVSHGLCPSWHGCSIFWKPGRIFGQLSSSLKQKWSKPRDAAFIQGREVPGFQACSKSSLAEASSGKPRKGKKKAGGNSIDRALLGPSAEYMFEKTGQHLSVVRAEQILLDSKVFTKEFLKKNKGVESLGDKLKSDFVRPVVDVLVAKFGPEGAGKVLDARGSLLRWYKYGDRLKLVIECFRGWEGCSEETVLKLLMCGKRKKGILEIGITLGSLEATESFYREKIGCNGLEIAECFLDSPELFARMSFGPKSTPQLVVDYFLNTLGVSLVDFKTLVLKRPHILKRHVDQLELRVAYLKKIGITQSGSHHSKRREFSYLYSEYNGGESYDMGDNRSDKYG